MPSNPSVFSCIYYFIEYIIGIYHCRLQDNGEMPASPSFGFSWLYLTIYYIGFNIILIYIKKSMTGMINNEVPREGAVW
jgi:hypothetical protein